ncbi:hypothetical protein GmRootV213_49840 (plasmid) [Variovorax sp. V213]
MLRPLLLAGLLSLPALAQAAEPRTCLVVGVSDGDTITARCGAAGNYEQIKVRFNGIDAPEKGQPFGRRAKEALANPSLWTLGTLAFALKTTVPDLLQGNTHVVEPSMGEQSRKRRVNQASHEPKPSVGSRRSQLR